jgi:hypothetical protein
MAVHLSSLPLYILDHGVWWSISSTTQATVRSRRHCSSAQKIFYFGKSVYSAIFHSKTGRPILGPEIFRLGRRPACSPTALRQVPRYSTMCDYFNVRWQLSMRSASFNKCHGRGNTGAGASRRSSTSGAMSTGEPGGLALQTLFRTSTGMLVSLSLLLLLAC